MSTWETESGGSVTTGVQAPPDALRSIANPVSPYELSRQESAIQAWAFPVICRTVGAVGTGSIAAYRAVTVMFLRTALNPLSQPRNR